MNPEQVDQVMSLGALMGFSWVLGVGWSAYRAIGWTDRIRNWAHGLPAEECSREGSPAGSPLAGWQAVPSGGASSFNRLPIALSDLPSKGCE